MDLNMLRFQVQLLFNRFFEDARNNGKQHKQFFIKKVLSNHSNSIFVCFFHSFCLTINLGSESYLYIVWDMDDFNKILKTVYMGHYWKSKNGYLLLIHLKDSCAYLNIFDAFNFEMPMSLSATRSYKILLLKTYFTGIHEKYLNYLFATKRQNERKKQ